MIEKCSKKNVCKPWKSEAWYLDIHTQKVKNYICKKWKTVRKKGKLDNGIPQWDAISLAVIDRSLMIITLIKQLRTRKTCVTFHEGMIHCCHCNVRTQLKGFCSLTAFFQQKRGRDQWCQYVGAFWDRWIKISFDKAAQPLFSRCCSDAAALRCRMWKHKQHLDLGGEWFWNKSWEN